jgi:hypothetical protein
VAPGLKCGFVIEQRVLISYRVDVPAHRRTAVAVVYKRALLGGKPLAR